MDKDKLKADVVDIIDVVGVTDSDMAASMILLLVLTEVMGILQARLGTPDDPR